MVPCPHCGAEHPEEQGRFCPDCGLPVADADPMTCPHCGAAYTAEQGRFCEACGMSIQPHVKRDEAEAKPGKKRVADEDLPRCRSCGTKTDAPVCPGCGNRMPEPEE